MEARRAKTEQRRKRLLTIGALCAALLVASAVLWNAFVLQPRRTAEDAILQFKERETLFELDKYVSYDDWKENSAGWDSDVNELLGSQYSNLSDDSKINILELKAERELVDKIYKEEWNSWAVNPSDLRISIALDSVSVEAVDDGSFTIVAETRNNASWPDKALKKDLSTTTSERHKAEFRYDLEAGTISMSSFERLNTKLIYY